MNVLVVCARATPLMLTHARPAATAMRAHADESQGLLEYFTPGIEWAPSSMQWRGNRISVSRTTPLALSCACALRLFYCERNASPAPERAVCLARHRQRRHL